MALNASINTNLRDLPNLALLVWQDFLGVGEPPSVAKVEATSFVFRRHFKYSGCGGITYPRAH